LNPLELLDYQKLRSYDWGSPEQAWLFYAVAAALLWGPLKWAWGRRWAMPLHPKEGAPLPPAGFAAWLPRLLRAAALALLVLALMRPQSVVNASESSVQSIDIYLALDVSGSMQATDVKPDRVTGAKQALKKFVDGLAGDRVGLVVFAGKAFTQCPLSLDHDVVKYFIDQVQVGTVGLDGTALGDGLLLAVQRLIQEPRRGQVIVIATDGRSNSGQPPLAAAQIAAQAGIKVYTVGIGQKGGAIVQVRDPWGRIQSQKMEEPDEALMTQMAQMTGGRYFRATDESSLAEIYRQIAGLEKREVKVKNRREADEHFYPYLWLGALLLLAEALLRLRLRVVM
jgi:Ca-activated chloride channel family protein